MKIQCKKSYDRLIISNIMIFTSNRNNWIKSLANDRIIIWKIYKIWKHDRNNALVEKYNELVDEEKEANEKLKRMESKYEQTCAQFMEGVGYK